MCLRKHGFAAVKLFKIMDMQDLAVLRPICSYGAEVLVVQVGNHILLKHWSIYKGDNLQLLMADGQRYIHQVGIDTANAVVYKALICTNGTNKFCRTKLMFQRSPDEARSACQISPGSLQIVAIAPLSSITTKASNTSASLGFVEVLGFW